MKDYRSLRLNTSNIDVYYPLVKKVTLIEKISEEYFLGDLLDIGCGEMPYKPLILEKSKINSYIGVDIENNIYQKEVTPDLFWDGKTLPINDNEFDCSLLIEVLEHTPNPEMVLKETHRILKDKGYLFLTVPFLWNLHDVPHDEYRYTPFSLERMFKDAGFEIIKMEALGGWHASLANMLALYSRRALYGRKRKWVSQIVKPIVSYLHKKDRGQTDIKFKEGQMITGIWSVVRAIK